MTALSPNSVAFSSLSVSLDLSLHYTNLSLYISFWFIYLSRSLLFSHFHSLFLSHSHKIFVKSLIFFLSCYNFELQVWASSLSPVVSTALPPRRRTTRPTLPTTSCKLPAVVCKLPARSSQLLRVHSSRKFLILNSSFISFSLHLHFHEVLS